MNKFLIIAIILLASIELSAQSPLTKGQSQLNAGIGLSERGIPVYVGLDYCFQRDFTVGGEVSYRAYRDDWRKNYYNHSIIGISGNVNYHFNRVMRIPRNWDFYAGLNLGFFIWSSPKEYEGTDNSGVGLGGQIGGRYYFSPGFGLNLEFGGGNSFGGGKFGATFRL